MRRALLFLSWPMLLWLALLAAGRTAAAMPPSPNPPKDPPPPAKDFPEEGGGYSEAPPMNYARLAAVNTARAAGPVWLQVMPLSAADRGRVPGELLLKLDGEPVGIVPALLSLTPAPPDDPHHLELARADGAYAFLLKLAVAADGVRVVGTETLACPQVRVSATVAAAAKGPAQLRLGFTRGEGPPCKDQNGRSPAGDELYKVRVEASVPAAQVYYPKVSGFLDRLLQRKVYDYVRQGPTAITLVVPYEPRDVPVIFKAPPRPDCVLNLHMEGPRYSDVTLVSGAQKLPAVAAGAAQAPPVLTCVFAAGPP